jgi:hypothetical protein
MLSFGSSASPCATGKSRIVSDDWSGRRLGHGGPVLLAMTSKQAWQRISTEAVIKKYLSVVYSIGLNYRRQLRGCKGQRQVRGRGRIREGYVPPMRAVPAASRC